MSDVRAATRRSHKEEQSLTGPKQLPSSIRTRQLGVVPGAELENKTPRRPAGSEALQRLLEMDKQLDALLAETPQDKELQRMAKHNREAIATERAVLDLSAMLTQLRQLLSEDPTDEGLRQLLEQTVSALAALKTAVPAETPRPVLYAAAGGQPSERRDRHRQ